MEESSPELDGESLLTTCPEQVTEGEVSTHQYNIVLDKYLDDLNFLDPKRVKEAFNDMRAHNSGGPL